MDIADRGIGPRLGEIEGMDDAGIEREIAAQLVHEIVQHAAISAMTIDDDEVARRQRRTILPAISWSSTAKFSTDRQSVPGAQSCSRERPIEQRRQLPQIEPLAPARDKRARELFRDDHVGIERQMRAMLLDRARSAGRGWRLARVCGHFREGQLGDRARSHQMTSYARPKRGLGAADAGQEARSSTTGSSSLSAVMR